MKNARNIAIILLIAVPFAFLPGGTTATNVILVTLSLAFLASVAWVASMLYREHRGALYLLGDRRRALLYGAVAVLVVTLTATDRLWQTSLGEVAWLVLLGLAVYVGFAVVWAARRY